jgi:hypothetical protein
MRIYPFWSGADEMMTMMTMAMRFPRANSVAETGLVD